MTDPCVGHSLCLQSSDWGFVTPGGVMYNCEKISDMNMNPTTGEIHAPYLWACHTGRPGTQQAATCADPDVPMVATSAAEVGAVTLCAWSDGYTGSSGLCTEKGATNDNGAVCQSVIDACPYHCQKSCTLISGASFQFPDTCMRTQAALAGGRQKCCAPFPPSPPTPSPPPPSPPPP